MDKKKTTRAKASLGLAEAPSLGNGKCKFCKGVVKRGDLCKVEWINPGRYKLKVCPECYSKGVDVSVPDTQAECDATLALLHADFGRLLVKYGINEINKIGSPIDGPIDGPIDVSKPFQYYGEDAGTVGELSKGNYSSKEWKKKHPGTNRRSPFSNFFFTRGETYDIPGIGKYKTTEAIIMSWKASVMGDGAILRCFKDHGDSLAGTASKSLGRWVTPFDDKKWCPKVVAMYITLIKWDQCPVFQAEMRRIHAEGYTSIHECSPNDSIWGTGSAVGEPLGSSNGVGGKNILGKAQTTILKLV